MLLMIPPLVPSITQDSQSTHDRIRYTTRSTKCKLVDFLILSVHSDNDETSSPFDPCLSNSVDVFQHLDHTSSHFGSGGTKVSLTVCPRV